VAAESLAAESARRRQLGMHEPLRGHMASCGPHLSSVSKRAVWREDLRQEPSAVVPLAGICAGTPGNGRPYREHYLFRKVARVRFLPSWPPPLGL
jgi:hypothetical protein